MSWLTDWQALRSRIQGLLDAGTFFFRAQHRSSIDSKGVRRKILLRSFKQVFGNLGDFRENYERSKVGVSVMNPIDFCAREDLR
jgi:hypothetical protein